VSKANGGGSGPNSLNGTPATTPTLGTKNSPRSTIELLTNTNKRATAFLELISRAREGLKYYSPELCEEGVNGTYFLKDKLGQKIAVFKPQDEEGSSENNPKKGDKSNLPTQGLLPGEAAQREVAAYLLDHEQFYGVPKTQLVKITHNFNNGEFCTKTGSLQEFIENDGCTEDFGTRSFPVDEVHKIGILDIQILNVDRHSGNILVRETKNGLNLVPIDQGFSLPDTIDCSWFEWMNWPQSKIPFSDESKAYISRINIEHDVHLLQKELGIRSESLDTLRTMTTLLKKAIEYNLTLYDIGSLICNKDSHDNDLLTALENKYAKSKMQTEAQKKRELKYSLSNSVSPN